MRAMRITAVLLAIAFGIGAAAAQPAKSMREQIVGTWDFVIAEITAANGSKTLPFGDKPKGQLIFTADGHFSQVHVSSGLPRIASNNRLAGTDADNVCMTANRLIPSSGTLSDSSCLELGGCARGHIRPDYLCWPIVLKNSILRGGRKM